MDPSPDPLLVQAYRARPDTYDEMLGPQGEVRPHWRYLADALTTLGLPALHDRSREARRLLHESGATYNVYGDPQGLECPWQLDPIPVLMPSVRHRLQCSTGQNCRGHASPSMPGLAPSLILG